MAPRSLAVLLGCLASFLVLAPAQADDYQASPSSPNTSVQNGAIDNDGASASPTAVVATSDGNGEEVNSVFGAIVPRHQFNFDLAVTELNPRVQYHFGLSKRVSVGLSMSLGTLVTSNFLNDVAPGGRLSFALAVPFRIGLTSGGPLSVALKVAPGFGLYTRYTDLYLRSPNVTLELGVNIGYWLRPGFLIGGGFDMPVEYAVQIGQVYFPLLVGPIMEYHLTDVVRFTVDAKVGPQFDRIRAYFAYRVLLGLAFAFN